MLQVVYKHLIREKKAPAEEFWQLEEVACGPEKEVERV